VKVQKKFRVGYRGIPDEIQKIPRQHKGAIHVKNTEESRVGYRINLSESIE
jgi:hypothetical protein